MTATFRRVLKKCEHLIINYYWCRQLSTVQYFLESDLSSRESSPREGQHDNLEVYHSNEKKVLSLVLKFPPIRPLSVHVLRDLR